jgi:hypothetical protein
MSKWIRSVWGVLLIGFLSAGALWTEGSDPREFQRLQEILKIPVAMARVTDASWPDPENFPDYFLIQDVHRHPQVQNQIAALVEQGYEQWGVKKVFLEGAFTALDLSVFHRVPKKTQALLLERLITEGSLSGPELAAVHIMEWEWRNPPVSPFQIFGLEDPGLYRKNVLAYRSVVAGRDRALEALLPIRRLQDTMHLQQPNDLTAQLDRTEELLRLKLTPPEYQAYMKGRASVPSTPALDPVVHAAEEFYQLAERRSLVFLDTAARTVPASSAPRILVVGGFHTAFMAARLRQEGKSFVILSPAVGAAMADDPYEKNLMETANALSQALAPTPSPTHR